MTYLQTLPLAVYALAAVTTALVVFAQIQTRKWYWVLPAIAGAAFAAYTVIAIAREGVLLFWSNHTETMTGNQVWFDLVIAVVIGFFLIAPRARAVGMPLGPWAVAVLATACFALLPMLARLLYLEARGVQMKGVSA